jgi:hypothetical protein
MMSGSQVPQPIGREDAIGMANVNNQNETRGNAVL